MTCILIYPLKFNQNYSIHNLHLYTIRRLKEVKLKILHLPTVWNDGHCFPLEVLGGGGIFLCLLDEKRECREAGEVTLWLPVGHTLFSRGKHIIACNDMPLK